MSQYSSGGLCRLFYLILKATLYSRIIAFKFLILSENINILLKSVQKVTQLVHERGENQVGEQSGLLTTWWCYYITSATKALRVRFVFFLACAWAIFFFFF